MYDIFKPRFLHSLHAPRILVGVGGSGSTSIDTVAREAAEAAQQSVDAITAQVGEVIAADQGVISSDGKLFVNETASPITLTGTSDAELSADGLSVSTVGLGPSSVSTNELADQAVSNVKMATMAGMTLKANDTISTDQPVDMPIANLAGHLPAASSSGPGMMAAIDKVKSELAAFCYDTVADMVASTEIAVGDVVDVDGYFSKTGQGGNRYLIVASGTGTADGGAYIDLTGSGHQALGLFPKGHFFEQWGAVKDGVSDDAEQISAALTWCAANDIKAVSATSGAGAFSISGQIALPENVYLDFRNSVVAPLSDDAGFLMKRNSGLVNVDFVAGAYATWVGPLLLVNDYSNSNIANYPKLQNISCRAYADDPNGNVIGTMLKLDGTSGTRVAGVVASGLYAANLQTVADFAVGDASGNGYLNSNSLQFDMIFNCVQCVKMDRLSTDKTISKNYVKLSYQSNDVTTGPILICNGWSNEFDFLVWDWSRANAPVVADFGSESRLNTLKGSVEILGVKDASSATYRNKIKTRIISAATMAVTAMEPSSVASGLFMGQVDNCLSQGNQRYLVTAPSVSSGNIKNAFKSNQNARPIWNNQTNLVVDIDLLEGKSSLRTVGLVFADGVVPDWVTFETSSDGTSWTEIERMPGSRVTTWTGMASTGSTFQYLRYTIECDVASDIGIAQFFAWWRGEEQGAYLPTGGGDIYGDTTIRGGSSAFFESTNGAGSAELNVDNGNRLQIGATGGVELNGTRILGDQQPSVADPTGGSVVDTECRAALIELADRIRNHGLIGL